MAGPKSPARPPSDLPCQNRICLCRVGQDGGASKYLGLRLTENIKEAINKSGIETDLSQTCLLAHPEFGVSANPIPTVKGEGA